MRVRWSRRALANLRAIRAYIAQDSPARATAMIARLRSAAEMLEQFPQVGRAGDIGATRELVVARSNYIIVYQVKLRDVIIIGVIHGAQQWPAE